MNQSKNWWAVRSPTTDMAKNFNVTARTVGQIWKRACHSFVDPMIVAFQVSPLKKNCGRKQEEYNWEAIVLVVPLHKRKTLQKLASSIGIMLTTAHRMKQYLLNNVIVPHSNEIKPHLHDYYHLAQVLYYVANLDLDDNH
jgi:hypothetical protein